MMEVPGDQVIHVVPMRDRFVAAACAVNVVSPVRRAAMSRRAPCRVGSALFENTFVHVSLVHVMQVTVVQVIDVSVVIDGYVATARAVNVIVIRVRAVLHHSLLLLT